MKLPAFLLIFSFIASSEALKANTWCSGRFLQNALGHCGAIFGATKADYFDYKFLKPARNQHMKCYRACQFNHCRAFNSDGSFAANTPETTGFTLSRRNPHLWRLAEEVGRYCIRALPAITFEHFYKRYTICDKAEDYIQCLRVNLPPGISFDGLF